jgi:hypothetical protein
LNRFFVELEIPNRKNFIIGAIYRPNTQPLANIDRFTENILAIVNIINGENKKLFLTGDFNIDLLKYYDHNKTTCFVDDLLARGMYPLINRPTRVTKTSATIIDHIYTNDTLTVNENDQVNSC